MNFNLSRNTMGVLLGAALAMTGCGGGGNDAGTQAANNFAAYVGTWTSDCASHAKDIVTITLSGMTLSLATTTNYYDSTTCSGAVVATAVSSAPLSAVSNGKDSVVALLPPATTASTIVIDKITATFPERTQSITGTGIYTSTLSGVPQTCVKFTNTDSACVPSGVQTTASASAGLYASGVNLYLLAGTVGTFTVNERFTKN